MWPGDSITVTTPKGQVTSKLGVEVYEDKTIRSIEPVFGTVFETEYGNAKPFMVRKHMLHAEDASSRFDREGNLTGFATLQTKVEVNDRVFKAGDYRSPLLINFERGIIGIRGANDLSVWFNTAHYEIRFS